MAFSIHVTGMEIEEEKITMYARFDATAKLHECFAMIIAIETINR